MATDEFPIEPTHLILGAILAFVGVLTLAGVALLAWWIWQQRHRLPNAKARLEREWRELNIQVEQQRDQALERARAAAGEVAQAKHREALRAKELQDAKTEGAALERALTELHESMAAAQAKALANVAGAHKEAAAKAAEAQRLARDLEAATQAHAKAAQAGRQALSLFEDLNARHKATLSDLAVLRDCQHQETTTVYSRETDPATGSRPYRAQGAMCRRCRSVLADTDRPLLPKDATNGSLVPPIHVPVSTILDGEPNSIPRPPADP